MNFNPRSPDYRRRNGQAPPAPPAVTTLPPEHQAEGLAKIHGAAILLACAGPEFNGTFQPIAFEEYREQFLAASGSPTDPIEIMLLDQALWAHFRLGQLQAKAGEATGEAAAMFNTAATRLMAESRKHALAIREYRSPVAPKQLTLVTQQNVAAGDQQIALIEGNGAAPGRPAEKISDIKPLLSG